MHNNLQRSVHMLHKTVIPGVMQVDVDMYGGVRVSVCVRACACTCIDAFSVRH